MLKKKNLCCVYRHCFKYCTVLLRVELYILVRGQIMRLQVEKVILVGHPKHFMLQKFAIGN